MSINKYDLLTPTYNALNQIERDIEREINKTNYHIRELEDEKTKYEDIIKSYKKPPKNKLEHLQGLNNGLSMLYNDLEKINNRIDLKKIKEKLIPISIYRNNYIRKKRLIEDILDMV